MKLLAKWTEEMDARVVRVEAEDSMQKSAHIGLQSM